MALEVCIAHTGLLLRADPLSFASLDVLKSWIARNCPVSVQHQILLTGQGKTVRLQSLRTEKEIYVFDRRLVQASSPNSTNALISRVASPKRYKAVSPPDEISDQNDLQAWRDLFLRRQAWARQIVDECAGMSETAQRRFSEIGVIVRALHAAFANLETHIRNLDQRFAECQNWGSELQRDHQLLLTDFENALTGLRLIPAAPSIVRFMSKAELRKDKQVSLEDLVDVPEVQGAAEKARTAADHFSRRLAELGTLVDHLINGTDKVISDIENSTAASALAHSGESIQLMDDISAIAKKVGADYETVKNYADTKQSVAQASKTALLHTRNFLPNLVKRSTEMDSILSNATDTRNAMATESVEILQAISLLNTDLGDAQTQLQSLEVPQDDEKAFESVSMIHRIPSLYASVLAEAIRRRSWNERIKIDSSTLANEMAVFQDEEQKRRRKWQKTVGSLFGLDKTEQKVLGLEVNLLGEEESWPHASKRDLDDLVAALQANGFKDDIINETTAIITELNNPTKQQAKRAKAFKAGSIHEASLGRSALLTRGDDDLIQRLQEDKNKLENKLKGSESRVRRLEDLLHRQSTISRSSAGGLFSIPSTSSPSHEIPNPLQSPHLRDDLSRRSSVSSRRFSSTQGPEERALAQRLLNMEAELTAEREKVVNLEREISARTTSANDIKSKMEEAISTKQDLMENFEAQQREFSQERTSLESEIKRLKARNEELEDDMDRILGSRENEKSVIVRNLQEDLENMRKEKEAEIQKAQGQVDFLRNESKLQRETSEKSERQMSRLREDNRELRSQLDDAETSNQRHLAGLQDVHAQLSPKSIPGDSGILVESVLTMLGDILSQRETTREQLSMAQADLESANGTTAQLKSELAATAEKMRAEEQETARLRESLAAQQAKQAALETNLSDERQQLSSLRAKFAEGETGSEALRSRVAEEEAKVTNLSADLAARQSQVGSLEEELRSYQERLQHTQSRYEKLDSRFSARSMRAKDLTQRLYAQNERLVRLLERLSYSVTRQGDSMVITRIPRAERQSANDSSDPGSSMRRSTSGIVNSRRSLADSGDLELLYWMQNEDEDVESDKYEAYLNNIGKFDVEAFSETILKRVRDIEYTARKYTKDARAYRDKAHAAQKEAHDKIAFKHFKEGDLALFLPTRNQATGAWAAFNVGAPHYFLREQDSHKLRSRDWLLARIHKVENRVVDLSKSMKALPPGSSSMGGDSFEDDNPFDLSDGLRWYLIDAHEEKPGAPSTPGLGKTTVASANIDATGSIQRGSNKLESGGVVGVSKTLTKSLDSRRSSTNSRKAPVRSSDSSKLSTATAPEYQVEGEQGTGNGGAGTQEAQSPAPGSTSSANNANIVKADNEETRNSSLHHNSVGPARGRAWLQGMGIGLGPSSSTQQLPPSKSATSSPNKAPQQRGRDAATRARRENIPPRIESLSPTKVRTTHRTGSVSPSKARNPHSPVKSSSNSTSPGPAKRSVIWDSLWSLDLSLESGKAQKK